MMKKNVIVKLLFVVEILGVVDIVNIDKIGMLMKNEMMVIKVVMFEYMFDVMGVGYDDNGGVNFDGYFKFNGNKVDWY